MRLTSLTAMALALAAATTGQAQPISFTYAGQSSDQGVTVYADGLLSVSQIDPSASLLSLTVSNVRSDYLGSDDNLFLYGTGLVGPDDADFDGLSIFDTLSGNTRNDLRFGMPNGLNGEMIDADGTHLSISDYFDGDDFELQFGFRGKKGGNGIRPGESVTFEYRVTGVAFSFLDDYYQQLDAYFAVARFKGVGAGGDDSSKTPGGRDGNPPPPVAAPLPATTGLAFSGLATLSLARRRRR